ncbi:5-oxoprolinase subunit PxpA [Pollutibacter soli]|uniref:LamB/YcsF family protein n=1 Tax=Pollutibacter soli TaxID=3034157 RepID=UPI003013B917
MQIDLNCDMGESYGNFTIGQDELLMPLISSANIACGFHGGDPAIIHKTVRLAQNSGVAIGAHPSYPDLQGFGRRNMPLDAQEIYDIVLYQVGAIAAFTKAAGIKLSHVKPHGALYNRASTDMEAATAIVHAVYYFDRDLVLYCPPNSCMSMASQQTGLRFVREAFADRTYTADGQLTSRSSPNALIADENIAAKQALQIIQQKTVLTVEGTVIPLEADTICIHGDGALAVPIANAIHKLLIENKIRIQSPDAANGTPQ